MTWDCSGCNGIAHNARSRIMILFFVSAEKFMSDFRYIVFKAKNGACKQECLGNVQESSRGNISVYEIGDKRKCDAAHDEQHRTSVLNL